MPVPSCRTREEAHTINAIVQYLKYDPDPHGYNTTPSFGVPFVASVGWGSLETQWAAGASGETGRVMSGYCAYRTTLQVPLDQVAGDYSFVEKQRITDAISSPEVIAALLRSFARRHSCPHNHPLDSLSMSLHIANFWAIVGAVGSLGLDAWVLAWAYPVLEVAAQASRGRIQRKVISLWKTRGGIKTDRLQLFADVYDARPRLRTPTPTPDLHILANAAATCSYTPTLALLARECIKTVLCLPTSRLRPPRPATNAAVCVRDLTYTPLNVVFGLSRRCVLEITHDESRSTSPPGAPSHCVPDTYITPLAFSLDYGTSRAFSVASRAEEDDHVHRPRAGLSWSYTKDPRIQTATARHEVAMPDAPVEGPLPRTR
ncbi:hypothetical protein B0H17DRAFT_1146654 [Mycena rosella]|uniref:Uncharacterized protein n=1 Tax=Mycena rosella TaxID=1033263 RepID=A0AAD7G0K2_MYCRO|nr:hypothetical protein B0H17DRAFT_1146654 [Mycena rosella]